MQADRIAEELTLLGAECRVVKNFNLAEIKRGKVVTENFDSCVFLDKDKASARLLEKADIRVINNSQSIEVCDDKMLTHIALSDNGILMPSCIYAPLCYYSDADVSESFLNKVADSLKYPLVGKLCYGSLGAGVFLIKNYSELLNFEKKYKLTAHFYQEYIESSNRDIRVIVIGGKFICAMQRENKEDFRSNIEQGGKGSNFVPDEDLIRLCEKVARLLNLDYCGIDILTDSCGNRYVCEVNSNAFFAEAERVCGVNIAKKFAEFIFDVKNA